MKCHACISVLLGLILSTAVFSQTVSSTLLGTVTDPADRIIPGAEVQIISQSTGATRSATTDVAGMFRFPNLLPGVYTLKINAPGFKAWTLRDITVSTGETRDVGRIALEIGSVAEQIEVLAEATPIQLASSEKSALIDGNQLVQLPLKGRDAFSFLQLLPGVLDTTNRDMISTRGDGGISVNGNVVSMTNLVDGIVDRDAGAASGVHFVPNMDAIGEVKLLASNYQAEYGRNAGGVVTMVTKSGTRDFHGTAWWTHRHEGFNANNYFDNMAGRARSPYRYNIPGWSLGGPVYIPGKFNVDRSKYFFFASQEFVRMYVPVSLQKRTMPTLAERGGDFSQSLDSKGNLIVIKDPTTGAPFPQNVIPAPRINPVGQAMLNYLPLPNYNPAPGTSDYRNYNFTDNASAPRPISDTVLRGDIYATSKLSGYFRMVRNRDTQDALYQGIQWSESTTKKGATMAQNHTNPGEGEAVSATYVFTPNTINQFTFGHSHNEWTYWTKDHTLIDRSLFGNVPWLFPDKKRIDQFDEPMQINAMHNFIPSVSFGGGARPNPASIGLGGYYAAYFNWNDAYVIQDNFSKIVGRHSFKAGIYAEKNLKTQPVNNAWNGSFSFDSDANNPLNSNDGYANALLGNFTTYTESNFRPVFKATFWNFDFYVQDNWRVTRRLTLDIGIRMVHQQPQYDQYKTFTVFREELYSPAKMPRMYVPYCDVPSSGTCPSGHRFARDPGTGVLAPQTVIGLFVPNSGDPATGMQVLGVAGVSRYSHTMRTFAPGPRVGFAWDVLGNGRLAVRGGFGIMYDRLEGNQVYNMSGVPPLTYIPTVYYNTIGALGAGGATGLLGPTNINPALYGKVPMTRVQNASLMMQRSLPGGLVGEIGYVGNWGYHINQSGGININPVPFGARFTNLDPTTGKPLNDNLLRPKFPGYANISRNKVDGLSNYHGLQTSLQRRYSRGLMFGMAYTFSKSLGVTSYNVLLSDNRKFFYGPNSNHRKHIFAANYSYDIPNLGRRLDNKILGAMTDNYTLSGILTAQSGPPITPSCGSSTGADITGSPNGTYRCLVVGDPKTNVPSGRIYNPAAFALPQPGTIGNLGNNALIAPGYYNLDMTVTKVIPLKSERRVFKLALQAFNVLNHTQFSSWQNSLNYSASGDPGKLVTSDAAKPTGTRPARILATSLRFEF